MASQREKILSNRSTFLILPYSYGKYFSFGPKVYFISILALEFERRKRESCWFTYFLIKSHSWYQCVLFNDGHP